MTLTYSQILSKESSSALVPCFRNKENGSEWWKDIPVAISLQEQACFPCLLSFSSNWWCICAFSHVECFPRTGSTRRNACLHSGHCCVLAHQPIAATLLCIDRHLILNCFPSVSPSFRDTWSQGHGAHWRNWQLLKPCHVPLRIQNILLGYERQTQGLLTHT